MGKLTADAPDEPAAGLLEVEVIALDEFAAAAGTPPGLIKMDIEGGEAAALRGARRLLRQAKPVLLLELHEAQATEAGTVFDELQQMGYEVRRLARQYPVVTSRRAGPQAYLLGLPPASSGDGGRVSVPGRLAFPLSLALEGCGARASDSPPDWGCSSACCRTTAPPSLIGWPKSVREA
jgi:hypothetical protein